MRLDILAPPSSGPPPRRPAYCRETPATAASRCGDDLSRDPVRGHPVACAIPGHFRTAPSPENSQTLSQVAEPRRGGSGRRHEAAQAVSTTSPPQTEAVPAHPAPPPRLSKGPAVNAFSAQQEPPRTPIRETNRPDSLRPGNRASP